MEKIEAMEETMCLICRKPTRHASKDAVRVSYTDVVCAHCIGHMHDVLYADYIPKVNFDPKSSDTKTYELRFDVPDELKSKDDGQDTKNLLVLESTNMNDINGLGSINIKDLKTTFWVNGVDTGFATQADFLKATGSKLLDEIKIAEPDSYYDEVALSIAVKNGEDIPEDMK